MFRFIFGIGLSLFFTLVSTPISAQMLGADSIYRALRFIPSRDTNRVIALNALADIYLVNNQVKRAELIAKQSLLLAETIDFTRGKGDSHFTLGKIYYKNDLTRDDKSIENYKSALDIYQELEDIDKVSLTLKTIGDYYYDLFYINDSYYELALEYYLEYLEVAKSAGLKSKMAQAYVKIGNLYDQLGESNRSNEYFLQAMELQDQLNETQIDDPHLFAKAKRLYDLQIQEIKNQKFISYALIVGIALLALMAFLLLVNNNLKRKNNQMLQSQKREVEKKNERILQQNQELEDKTKEIAEQRDELADRNQVIQETQDQLQESNNKLNSMNRILEEKVQERTADLQVSNEALTTAIQELDTLVYRASHDFRGPVSTLLGLAQLGKMELESNPEVIQDFFARIELTAQKMDTMLEKLHQVSYILGKNLDKEIIQFESLLERAQENLQTLIEKSNTQIELDLEPSAFFYCDAELLSFIIENLLENTMYFRKADQESNPVRIQFSSSLNEVSIRVEDQGQGIEPAHYAQIYDMFFRGSEASEGNGLGLYVVKKALDRLEGKISLLSILGEKTEFEITLPK